MDGGPNRGETCPLKRDVWRGRNRALFTLELPLGARAEARDTELVGELARAVGHGLAHLLGLEQNGLAAL
jgi:hypothetical protein